MDSTDTMPHDKRCPNPDCGATWTQGKTTLGTLANPLPDICPECGARPTGESLYDRARNLRTRALPLQPDPVGFPQPETVEVDRDQWEKAKHEWRDAYVAGFVAGAVSMQLAAAKVCEDDASDDVGACWQQILLLPLPHAAVKGT